MFFAGGKAVLCSDLDCDDIFVQVEKENITIKEKCIEQIYNIIEKCTDEQALFFMNILDCIYENM